MPRVPKPATPTDSSAISHSAPNFCAEALAAITEAGVILFLQSNSRSGIRKVPLLVCRIPHPRSVIKCASANAVVVLPRAPVISTEMRGGTTSSRTISWWVFTGDFASNGCEGIKCTGAVTRSYRRDAATDSGTPVPRYTSTASTVSPRCRNASAMSSPP